MQEAAIAQASLFLKKQALINFSRSHSLTPVERSCLIYVHITMCHYGSKKSSSDHKF